MNYDGVLYANGRTERGGVYGTVSSSGTATDLGLYAINCRFLNPTDFRAAVLGATLYAGDQRGGSFGDPGGPKLTARGGLLAGHISGRDCFGQQVNADVSLQRVSNFVQACANRPAGTYIGSFANSCGGSGSGSIMIRSVGCYFSGIVPELVALEGNMTGPAKAAVRLRLLDPCSGTASGSLNMNTDGSIAGTFSGTSDGGFGCCPAGPVSGTFALTR